MRVYDWFKAYEISGIFIPLRRTFPTNQGFDSNYDGWSYSAESPATAGYDSSYGNPAGSIYSYIYTRLRTTNYYSVEWTSAFVYEKKKPVAYAKFSFDYRVTAKTRLNEIKITAYIEDPNGVRHQISSQQAKILKSSRREIAAF